jgi:hypothetical protein
MSSPTEYRVRIAECLDSAMAAQSDAERNTFFELAKVWLEEAVQADIPKSERCIGPNGSVGIGDEAIIQWNIVLDAASSLLLR